VLVRLSGFDEYCPSPRVADRSDCHCTPVGGKQPCRHPRLGQSDFAATPVGGKQPRCCPLRGLSSFVDQVSVQGGAADPGVRGYVGAV